MNRTVDIAKRPQQALQSYLDGLLQEATEAFEPPAAPAVTAAPVSSAVAKASEPATDLTLDEFRAAVLEEQVRDARREPLDAAPQPALIRPDEPLPWALAPEASSPVLAQALLLPTALPVVEPEPQSMPAPAPIATPPAAGEPAALPAAAPAVDHGGPAIPTFEGRPGWAAEPFECLLFDVAGLTLAVPLVCLGSIFPLAGQELTPLFGQPEWFLGILTCQAGNLKVLDTARWVMPDRYRDDFQQGLQYVISVQGYEWGLAVHQVSRSVRLEPGQVKWRDQRGQRPWLAGTVVEHMCALLDVAALAELIASGAIKRQMQEAKDKAAAEARAKAQQGKTSKR
ncbi:MULTISPECIES: chemotaxis protein CheW [unclassified Pseudomonas]|uniref:chemotaxis protein CheW n=1 Tax=unclassified Pseudomonas TaxID=196821 RepID=UPI000BC81FF7|nr:MULTISPECIES: CheW domain-containing protein [unclassified Pseudomonas]PVZ13796.1 purine-binding chemotaxis protein CheW [Pseudomonas sp. URIL14HWK12:I12]PVZ24102.1 purine-binding chemotaxis protein CheW [Pseudomonas sp. URIL14HWK12:I10]PVZ33259.1 purine-binding chemotaxis protein CheW [Pseudomonas sp. URIL14HWK12:I11]SNZ10902.1 purine-binding chemotaxis protein CheW [Pseudomonas sp. URIL14HWK12:I9]